MATRRKAKAKAKTKAKTKRKKTRVTKAAARRKTTAKKAGAIRKKTAKKAPAKRASAKKARPAAKVAVKSTPRPPAPPAAAPAPAAPAQAAPREERIGVVTHYYNHLSVAIVRLESGHLHVGDTIHIRGHTTDFTQRVESLEVEHAATAQVGPNDDFGLKVAEHAREHDVVYKVLP